MLICLYLAPFRESPWLFLCLVIWSPQYHLLTLFVLSKLSPVLPGHSEGVSHCVLDSAQPCSIICPEPSWGCPFAAATFPGTLCGETYSSTTAEVERYENVMGNLQNTLIGGSQTQKVTYCVIAFIRNM